MAGLATDGLTWTWSRQPGTGAVATVNVPSVGVHTVNVWMRESGVVLDKLVLTSSSSYAPTGTGPAESQLTIITAPTVVTNPATSVTATGGVLNGGVNPNGLATTGWFEWGTSPTLSTFSSTSTQALGSGTTSQSITATLTGLTAGTTYYFRAAASNSSGPSKGSIASFSTTAAGAAPTVVTNPATSVTATGGVLNGGVNPNGLATTGWFEWGTSPTLSTFSSTSTQALGSGTTSQSITATLTGLTAGTTYYFRAAASNSSGPSKGSIASFSTTAAGAAPTVVTNPATSVTATGGVLNGGVNPNGLATTGWFEWGTSPTLSTFSSTSTQALGSGTTSQSITATLTGLTAGTTYYFRAAASNSSGPSKGSIASFSTTAAGAAPTVVTNPATSVTATGGVLNGGVNPNGLATTGWFEWGTSPTLSTFSSTSTQALGSGTTSQSITATLTGLTAGTTYYFRAAASNSSGPSKGSIASFSPAAPGGFVQDGTGLVSMESEHYQSIVSLGAYAWTPVLNSGYSGTGALQPLPNDEPNPLAAGSGPRLDYQVQFNRTGTHYVWIRALGYSGASDSLYVGLDGGTSSAVYMAGLATDGLTWTWSRQPGTGAIATVNVPSVGVHTVNVWMRESGVVLDKLVLTSSSSYAPTGAGPAETVGTASVAPTVVTNPATSVTATGGVLNGGVNPNGLATTGWFEWGTSPTLSTFSSTSTQALGSGTTSQSITATLTGLTAGTTYYFRAAASNSSGPSKGSIASFSTTAAGRRRRW